MRQPDASTKSISGTDEQIFIEDSAQTHYHPNVIMKRGEAFFEKQEYAEALNEYNRFLDLYRSHALAPYAAFRIGEVHLKMANDMGASFFGKGTILGSLLPRSRMGDGLTSSYDRDPEPIQKAIAAFERVRNDFPGSRYDAQAQQKLDECHDWLAQMHLFVGQFYYRRGAYLAAAHRFEQILKLYPDKPVAPDTLYFLASTYHELGADDWARDNLVLLARKYPDSKASAKGQRLLVKLGGVQPDTLLAHKSDSIPFSDIGPTAGQSTQFNQASDPLLSSGSPLEVPGAASAISSGQTFTACRLGAWC